MAIDERGAEAAESSAVVVNRESSPPPLGGRLEFAADHPFLFSIVDEKSKAILFLGRVSNQASGADP